MKSSVPTLFSARQNMAASDYEIFYYHTKHLKKVSPHVHKHYEFYFFLEGSGAYTIHEQTYLLAPGDCLLIPPQTTHDIHILEDSIPYRRIVLWLNSSYFDSLCKYCPDFSYGYDYVKQQRNYHFRFDAIVSRDIQARLLELLEETKNRHPFQELHCHLKVSSFLAHMNRIIYQTVTQPTQVYEIPLYLRICDYVTNHLHEEVSLKVLSSVFFVSKYHISHTFKEHMGISLYQYLTKKRLQAIKNNIPSGTPLTQLAQEYGFAHYTSFYRAFKKEYGITPKDYKDSLPAEVPSAGDS